MKRTKRKYTRKAQPVTVEAQTVEKVVFDEHRIHSALLHAEDILDRAVVPFLLLGEVARQMSDGLYQFEADGIDIGINRKDFSQGALEIIQMLVPDLKVDGNKLYFESDGVPVRIKIIERKYQYLLNPDTRYYFDGIYRLPNPFEKYWKARFLVF